MITSSNVKNRYTFSKFIIQLAALVVKIIWVGDDRDIFVRIFFADALGLTAAL